MHVKLAKVSCTLGLADYMYCVYFSDNETKYTVNLIIEEKDTEYKIPRNVL